MDLVLCRGSKLLDDLNELVNTRLSWEKGLTDKKLGDDTTDRPDIDGWRVVSGSKNEFRRAVVPGADVRNVNFALDEALCRAEVTNLQCVALWVHEQVLRLNVTMTIAE